METQEIKDLRVRIEAELAAKQKQRAAANTDMAALAKEQLAIESHKKDLLLLYRTSADAAEMLDDFEQDETRLIVRHRRLTNEIEELGASITELQIELEHALRLEEIEAVANDVERIEELLGRIDSKLTSTLPEIEQIVQLVRDVGNRGSLLGFTSSDYQLISVKQKLSDRLAVLLEG